MKTENKNTTATAPAAKTLLARNSKTGLYYNKASASFDATVENATRLDEPEFAVVSHTFQNAIRYLAPNHVTEVTISGAEHAALVAVAKAAADFQRTIDIQSEGDLNSRDFLEYVTSPAVHRPLSEALAALAAVRNQ